MIYWPYVKQVRKAHFNSYFSSIPVCIFFTLPHVFNAKKAGYDTGNCHLQHKLTCYLSLGPSS